MKIKAAKIIDIVKEYDYKTLNYRLIIYTIVLSIIGILSINSAADDSTLVTKQIIGLVGGVILMIIFALIKYDILARYYWLMYFISVVLLLAVLVIGTYHSGAKRWIDLGFIQVQPSEICKIMLLFFFASFITRNRQLVNSWKFLLLTFGLFVIPVFLISKQPDLSTSIVFLGMFCAIIFVSDISGKLLRKIIFIVIPLVAAFIVLIFVLPKENNILEEYQYNRLVGFYDENNAEAERIRYQQENSVIAIASGGTKGKGLNNNSTTSVKNAEFISEPQTDFIFTIIGEEMGFWGSMVVVILMGLIVFECFLIGIRAREQIGRIFAIGYGTLIGLQAFINLGVVTMIIPNTGLTLPFVSYGLSSLMTMFIGIGIVLNIGLKNKFSFGGSF